MKCMIVTDINVDEVNGITMRMNAAYKEKLGRSIKMLRNIPAFMMMGKDVKQGRIQVLEEMHDNLKPIELVEYHDKTFTFEVNDYLVGAVQDSKVMKAMSMIKMQKSTKDMMLKEILDTYKATYGEWVEQEVKSNVNES